MNSFFKASIIITALLLAGCISQNLVSTPGFDYYVSKQKFIDRPCGELITIEKAFHGEGGKDSGRIVLESIGVSSYRERIPGDIFRMMVQSNYKSLQYALIQKGCRG